MQDFNQSSSHPDMATNRSVSAGDQLSNPSSGGWERVSSSYPCKGLAWVTSWGAQSGDRGGGGRLGHGGVIFFRSSLLFLGAKKPERREKIRSDLKNCNESWSLCRVRLARETLAIKWRGISFRCGALYNALSIRNPDFLIFAFRFLILIPA